MNRCFYQDFLMDFPYDNGENPKVELKLVTSISEAQEFDTPFNLFDIENGYIRYLSLQKLHDATDIKYWNHLFSVIPFLESVIIFDDIVVENTEVSDIKNFYLKAYYWNLKQYNNNVFVYVPTNKRI